MASSERITPEFTRYSHEEIITTAYEMMVATRTALKAKLKGSQYVNTTKESREFYQAFTFFYGLMAPKLKNNHNKLKERIKSWDEHITFKPLYNRSNGIEKGIELSEELQEAVKFDGVFT
jgi:hypothetical protein